MKKIFSQLGHWIFENKKKLIYGVLALIVGQICFFGIGEIGLGNDVFATESASQSDDFQQIITNKIQLYNFIEKALYVVVYPVLILTGKLVDNSFVYGEVFGFDVILRKLWNFVRNLANFGLGFIFIYYIFNYLITHDSKKGVKWLIIRALIAGIGIQASWFLMAALIDVSTLLTYGVGGLPLSVLGGEGNQSGGGGNLLTLSGGYNPHILKTVVSVDAGAVGDLNVYMTNLTGGSQKIYVSECQLAPSGGTGDNKNKENLIIAPKMVYYYNIHDKKYEQTQKSFCHYGNQIYKFKELDSKIASEHQGCSDSTTCQGQQNKYKDAISNVIRDHSNTGFSVGCQYLKIGERNETEKCGWDLDNNWVNEVGSTKELSDLIKDNDSKSYAGVFTSLYSSLLNAGRNIITEVDQSEYVKFLAVLLTLGHMIAIVIPLIISALVFMMRIGVIWLAISLSPLIVLLETFGFFNNDKIKSIKILDYLKVGNLVGIIFSPAVICFAISLSTVLVRAIERINSQKILTEPLIFGGLIQIDLKGFTIGLGQLVISCLGIAITWFLVWAAIESSKVGKTISDKSRGLIESALGTIPIVPVVNKDGQFDVVGVNAAKKAVTDRMERVETAFSQADSTAIHELFDPVQARQEAEERAKTAKVTSYTTQLKDLPDIQNWQQQNIDGKTFASFDPTQQESIILEINKFAEDRRKQFGAVSGELKVNGKTYKFDRNDSKYVVDSGNS